MKLIYLLLLITIVCGDDFDVMVEEIDYSELAILAEVNKHNILKFLEESMVQQKYKALYENLLDKLIGSTRRIVRGKNTSIAAVPWQVSLRDKSYPICGGSILTDTWLVTAAHCLCKTRTKELTVRLGSSWRSHGGQMYDIKNSFPHPKYCRNTKTYDVGLINLYSPLRFTPKILPIRLVAKSARLPADKSAIISGWGKIREGGPGAPYLQSATANTISMKLCRQTGVYRNSIHPISMFCAGSLTPPSTDSCQGDSGGPIVSEGILIGVVSWGLGCARSSFPGVYSRLSSPAIWDWIYSHINNTSLIT